MQVSNLDTNNLTGVTIAVISVNTRNYNYSVRNLRHSPAASLKTHGERLAVFVLVLQLSPLALLVFSFFPCFISLSSFSSLHGRLSPAHHVYLPLLSAPVASLCLAACTPCATPSHQSIPSKHPKLQRSRLNRAHFFSCKVYGSTSRRVQSTLQPDSDTFSKRKLSDILYTLRHQNLIPS